METTPKTTVLPVYFKAFEEIFMGNYGDGHHQEEMLEAIRRHKDTLFQIVLDSYSKQRYSPSLIMDYEYDFIELCDRLKAIFSEIEEHLKEEIELKTTKPLNP